MLSFLVTFLIILNYLFCAPKRQAQDLVADEDKAPCRLGCFFFNLLRTHYHESGIPVLKSTLPRITPNQVDLSVKLKIDCNALKNAMIVDLGGTRDWFCQCYNVIQYAKGNKKRKLLIT